MPGAEWCYGHDPERAQERRRNASKADRRGGSARPPHELADLKRRISELIDDVLDGTKDRGRVAVAIQGFNALRGVLELERKIRELDELEERIERLESQLARRKDGSHRWGA